MRSIKLKHIRIIAICVALSLSLHIHAQHFGIAISGGGGSYKMSDLKYYQEFLLSGFPVEGKMISLFPPYFTGGVSVFRTMNTYVRIGVDYNYSSTGARAYYSDYSGSRSSDMIVKAHQIGVSANYRLLGGNKVELLATASLSATISKLEISELISASSVYFAGISSGYNSSCKSTSPAVSAGLEGLYHGDRYSFGIDAGYYHDFTNDLIYVQNSSYKLTDPNDSERILTADWSGFRAHVKIIFWLSKPYRDD